MSPAGSRVAGLDQIFTSHPELDQRCAFLAGLDQCECVEGSVCLSVLAGLCGFCIDLDELDHVCFSSTILTYLLASGRPAGIYWA